MESVQSTLSILSILSTTRPLDHSPLTTINHQPPTTVGLISLGCAKNLVDTQIMSGVLVTEGLALAHDADHADIVLINTCAFIASAREEACAIIAEMSAHKARGGCRAIIVAGCLPQRYRGQLVDQFPLVDAWIGVDELERIAEVAHLLAAEGGEGETADGREWTRMKGGATASPPSRSDGAWGTGVPDHNSGTPELPNSRTSPAAPGGGPLVLVSDAPSATFEPRLPTLVFCNPSFAYLKIAEGCNHACAYCAIPGIRGRLRSRTRRNLVAEARALLKDGRRELNLIAQDTTSYGRDRRGAPRLADLVRALDALPGDFWLRLLYGYPAHLDDDLLDALSGSRHVVPYLDIPIQHSHPGVLRAMRRADTLATLPDLAPRLRARWPGVALRTTCLVGFPGETEAHFEHLVGYVEAARFDHLGVFTYSAEEGTAAAALPNPVPAAVAAARRDRLLAVQQRIAAAANRARIGTAARVLLQGPAPTGRNRWIARAPWQAPDVDGVTRVSGLPAAARAGDFATVRITATRGFDLGAVVRGEW